MKRACLLWLLLLALLAQNAAFASQDVLPASDEMLHGFTVMETGTERIIDAPTMTFVHDKTGAIVHWIMAEDIECTFSISFRTPPINDKGLPHVLEHICVSGSEKYPSPNLFFSLATQTYNTYINAVTYENMTSYPMASLSDEQLLVLADYYLSGVFQPLVYSEERLFQREAWRYTLADAEAPIELTGTVLSEMRGTQSMYETSRYAMRESLYPGSIRANNSGGNPDHIQEITWDEIKAYHTAYYHPSNSLTILYGDIDPVRFLEMLDGYFSAFDRKEISIDDGRVTPQAVSVTHTALHPAEANAPTEDAAFVHYAFVANGASLQESIGLKILGDVLSYETSPLVQNIREEFPTARVYADCTVGVQDPCFIFAVEGVGEMDAERIKVIIDESLAQVGRDGLDASAVEATLAYDEMFLLLAPNMSGAGLGLSNKIAEMWAGWNTLSYYNPYMEVLGEMKAEPTDEILRDLLHRYLLDNNHAALVTTVPAPGMATEKEKALTTILMKKKEAMTAEEINTLVEESRDMDVWSQEEPPAALLSRLQAVEIETLPEETRAYAITDVEQDGVRLMAAGANVNGVNSISIFVDTSHVPQELLHYMKLYTRMIGMADTPDHDVETLQTMFAQSLFGFSVHATTLRHADGSFRPILRLYWLGTDEKLVESLELAIETALYTCLDDMERLRMVISQEQMMQRSMLNESSHVMQEIRALGIVDDENAYTDYLNGVAYYDFIMNADTQLAEDPDRFVGKLMGHNASYHMRPDCCCSRSCNTLCPGSPG